MGPKHEPARLVELPADDAARRRQPDAPRLMEFSESEPGLADYIWTILEHRTLVIAATIATLMLGAAYIFVVPPTYHSDVLIQVEDKTKNLSGLDDLQSMFSDKTPADTEIEIIRSRSLVGSVVDELNLSVEAQPRTFPIFGGAFFRRYDGDDLASPPLGLRSFAWGGELILDAVSRTYLRQNVERKSAEAAKTLEFLEQQLPELKKNVETSEAALNAYQQQHGTTDLSLETQAILNRAAEIETAISELELNRSELRQRFTENHPAMVSLNEKVAKLRAERTAMNAKMKGLPEQEVDTARLERDVKTASELYFMLLNRTQELKVVKSGTIGNVRILDTALKPYEPVSPKKALVLALSLFLGLGLGLGGAFTKKALDQGVEDPSEVEAATGLSIFATVPHSEKVAEMSRQRSAGAAANFVALAEPNDLAVESLRSLRTALQFALVDASSNIVTMGGPRPSVGKSFLSVNLAHVLATSGKRVLLIDGDLRRGHLHKYVGGQRAGGVSEIVSGQLSISDATRKTAEPNLDFIATGRIPPNPSELVGSPRFQSFLSEVSARYDLVLIDTPPILAVTDPALIGRHAGVNLMALRAGKHPMREIMLALKRFADAGVRIHGLVLNDVNAALGKFSRYAHSYHYQYEYKSASDDD